MLCLVDWEVVKNDILDGFIVQGGDKGNYGYFEDVYIVMFCCQCIGYGFGGDGDQVDNQ